MTLNELKDLITSKIKTNGNRSITGISLQNVLSSIVNYASNAIRPDTEQTFTSSEQRQSRKNIGAVGVDDLAIIEDRIINEENRAQEAEQSLAQGLAELRGNTQGAASELNRRIAEEQERATNKENEIADSLQSEKERAISVENEIKTSVEDLKNSITTVLNTPV